MNLLGFLKKIGTAAISTHPAGAAALTLINTFLPDDKRIESSATGEQALSATESLTPTDKAKLLNAKIELAIVEEEGRTERYVAMCKSDGQETRAKIVDKAMNALIILSLIFVAAVAYVYATKGAALAFSYEMGFVFITVSGTFAYVVKAYFGDLRKETQSRHATIDDKPQFQKGFAGLVNAFKGK
jgi:hypothetical protein